MPAKGPATKSNFNRFKVGFCDPALWAGPTLGNISPAGAGGDAIFWATRGFVIDKAANNAKVGFHGDSQNIGKKWP